LLADYNTEVHPGYANMRQLLKYTF